MHRYVAAIQHASVACACDIPIELILRVLSSVELDRGGYDDCVFDFAGVRFGAEAFNCKV